LIPNVAKKLTLKQLKAALTTGTDCIDGFLKQDRSKPIVKAKLNFAAANNKRASL
jgi:hypothetical protein